MERADIERIFEAFFEKYKKTEGDRTAWSAFWTETTAQGTLEINLTKCPRGTVFKVFVDKKKITETIGWDEFFLTMDTFSKHHPDLYEPEVFFSNMESML